MPAMAPPPRPELEVEPVLVSACTMTVVVGSWRPRRRVMPLGRVGVGAMMDGFWWCSFGSCSGMLSRRKLGMWWREKARLVDLLPGGEGRLANEILENVF